MGPNDGPRRTDAKARLVEAFESFGGAALRDVWLFDQSSHESMYVRDDVAEKIGDVDVAQFVDNERYGFVTRDTYGDLHYASYEYTVRGFDGYEQFRTFLAVDDEKIGVFASFDRREEAYDFKGLHGEIRAVVDEYPTEAFVPV